MDKNSYFKKFLANIPIVLLPIVSYLVLGPLEIYCGNRKDFSFSVGDFFGWFILIGILILLLISLLVALMPDKIAVVLKFLLFTFGILSYVQYMFLNSKLSEADGSPMNWNAINNTTLVNTIIWGGAIAVLIVLRVVLKKYWKNIELYIPIILIAMQLVAVISLIPNMLGSKNESELQMSGEKQFKIASKDNVIMFVMDTLGTQQLQAAMEQYPDLLDGLDDFTYFTNADCHYYCTFPSMTHIFTGEDFDFKMESNEWMKKSWESDRTKTFYDKLHKEGYECNLYSPDVKYEYGTCDNLYGKFDNITNLDIEVDELQLTKLLLKTSIYRYVPYLVKPSFEVLTLEFGNVVAYKDGITAIEDNALFNAKLNEVGLTVDSSMNRAFIVQHLFGTHQPYTTDEYGGYIAEAEVNETVSGCINIFKNYVDKLKEVGLYDSATIILTADHGSWFGNDEQPILIVKKASESHEKMVFSSAPVSFDDFQASILNYVGVDYKEFGTSFDDWNDGDERDRTVYMRMSDDNYPEVKGSSFNVYYGYKYKTDKEELRKTVDDGPDEILPATPWD